jgi:hypothetical protein
MNSIVFLSTIDYILIRQCGTRIEQLQVLQLLGHVPAGREYFVFSINPLNPANPVYGLLARSAK